MLSIKDKIMTDMVNFNEINLGEQYRYLVNVTKYGAHMVASSLLHYDDVYMFFNKHKREINQILAEIDLISVEGFDLNDKLVTEEHNIRIVVCLAYELITCEVLASY